MQLEFFRISDLSTNYIYPTFLEFTPNLDTHIRIGINVTPFVYDPGRDKTNINWLF
jgi:hypothetical protein